MITLEEKLDKYLASLLVDEVFEAELVLFQSHLFRVVAVPDGGHKSLNGIRMATFFLLYNSTLSKCCHENIYNCNIFKTTKVAKAAT